MNRARLFFLLLSSTAFSFLTTAVAADHPNIVLVMTDDQGYGDLGVTGNPLIETSNIDAMAGRSASMSYFYVSPVCAPTRACLMTGRYNYRTRVIDTWIGRAMMDPDELTLAEAFKEAGYATGIFGKWHLGDCYPMRAIDQGFEEALIHKGGGLAQPSEPPENNRRYTDAILFHNGRQVSTTGYCTDVYFDAAVKFIEQCQTADRPFFVYLPTNAPHGPFHDVPQDLYEKYRAKDLSPVLLGNEQTADMVARAFAMIENVDQNVGRLFASLERLRLTENTIVIFMVDNGPNSRRYVGNMRGNKSSVHEGGIRSPFYVQWPARLKAGTSSDRIAAHIDVMPTLLDAAGVPVPAGLKLDGRSLLPLLEGRDVDWPGRTIVIQSHRGDRPVRYHNFAIRDQQFKLVRPTGFGLETPTERTPFELYDLLADPREANNLAETHSEVLARLKTAYDAWFDDVSSTRPDNYAPPRIVVGTDHETHTVLTKQDWRKTAGDAWGTGGRWLLHIAPDARFDVTVLLETEISGRAELRIGGNRWAQDVREPAKKIVLSNVSPTTGDTDLEFQLHRGGQVVGPYHVLLERK